MPPGPEACLSTNLKLEDGGSEIVPVDGRRWHQRHLVVIVEAVQEVPTGLGVWNRKIHVFDPMHVGSILDLKVH